MIARAHRIDLLFVITPHALHLIAEEDGEALAASEGEAVLPVPGSAR